MSAPNFQAIRCFGGPLDGQTRPLMTTVLAHEEGEGLHRRTYLYLLRQWLIRGDNGDPWTCAYAYVLSTVHGPVGDHETEFDAKHEATHAVFGGGVLLASEMPDGTATGFAHLERAEKIAGAARKWFAAMSASGDAAQERRALVELLDEDLEARKA